MKNLILFILLTLTLQSCENKTKKTLEISNEKTKTQEIKQVHKAQKNAVIPTPTDKIVDEFYQAIFDNDNEKVRKMLETEFPANYEPKNKILPLQAVIWTSDNIYLSKLFVEGGTNINNKENPLIVLASEYGRLKIMQYLIEKGCDIKSNDSFNTAGFYQFYDCAKLLLINGANQKKGDVRGKLWVFEQAVIKDDYEVLNKLNLTNDEINTNNCNGETALIIAVKQNNVNMVKFLLDKNADKNKTETFDCGDDISYGKTPIQIAKKNNFQEIISLLQ